MPYRNLPLVTKEFYHVFNRGIDKRPTFTDKREFDRALKIIHFYHHISPPIKLSRYLLLNEEEQNGVEKVLKGQEKLVDILCFCLMPNHFHFLFSQVVTAGISKFISQFLNSYTRYFNTKHERVGPLFLDQFKAVRIEKDEQLLHMSRYIHLNPHTSFVVKKLDDLINYQWSSFPAYLSLQNYEFCSKDQILNFFKNKDSYKKFVFNQAEYQRNLAKIKHLVLED